MTKVYHMRKRMKESAYGAGYKKLFGFRKENVRWLTNQFVGIGPSKDYMTHMDKMKLCLQYLADPDMFGGPLKDNVVVDTTVSKTIINVIRKIADTADMFISFPQTKNNVTQAKNEWKARYKFPSAIGVLGCTQIRLKKSKVYGNEFLYRNGAYALNVQATCDGKGMFTSVDSRWPGSFNNVRIWKSSVIREIMTDNFDTVLLADDNYDAEPFLMTPFPNAQDEAEISFNDLLKEEKLLIEDCFKQLKKRFPILKSIFSLKHRVVSDIVTACFVLHNLSKILGEDDAVTPGVSPKNNVASDDCEDNSDKSQEKPSATTQAKLLTKPQAKLPKKPLLKYRAKIRSQVKTQAKRKDEPRNKPQPKPKVKPQSVLQTTSQTLPQNNVQSIVQNVTNPKFEAKSPPILDLKPLPMAQPKPLANFQPKFLPKLQPEPAAVSQVILQAVPETVPEAVPEADSEVILEADPLNNRKDNPDADVMNNANEVIYVPADNDQEIELTQIEIPTNLHIMSNTNLAAFGNGIQQHNLTATIDYVNQNGATTLATYPSVTSTEGGTILDKQTSTTFFASSSNPATFYSTQLVTPTPGTILITNNFSPDESSTISGVNNNFNNSSIRIVTHNNNNNPNHTNNNNITKSALLNETNCNLNIDKQQKQHYHHLHHLHHQSSPASLQHPPSTSPPKMPNSLVTTSASAPTATSTVVLDRINICINNHYGDTAAMSPSAPSSQSTTLSNPMIPSVIRSQHPTMLESCQLSAPCVQTINVVDTRDEEMHIDEPDSTTSTHCQSDLTPMEQDHSIQEQEKCIPYDMYALQKFDIGEDALVKRRDGRYYLGTVVDIHRQQYLVQFDDKTDYWSNVDELKKLGADPEEKPTCLVCKCESDDDVVEVCERCGRGYHRQCTDEISPKSDVWMCKRCVKPMKFSLDVTLETDENIQLKQQFKSEAKDIIKQFPYALNSLTWDEKHRVNLEHIYCYCGKSGQFDNNMIQCCKCKQWFHSHCVQCVKNLFRGDVFFIFGCSVCNNGKEFLRRIEMQWVDLAHLILYNMAIMKNFQKYHHLHKDIYTFALEKRAAFQLPESMLNLSDSEFKANLLKTLLAHPKLFQCGKEIKKDHAFWGLRSNKPPQGPTYDVQQDEVLCNQLIKEKLKINILPFVETDKNEYNKELLQETIGGSSLSPPSKLERGSNINPSLDYDDDDKFTSDDEIPIKQIIEKVKTSNSTIDLKETKPAVESEGGICDQSNDNRLEEKDKKEKIEASVLVKVNQKNSRKRKAFTLSRSYKDSDKPNDVPRSTCDSSSDENSSSSRGTLDLIIPPPKDFLGVNNPFRITPKKSDENAFKSSSNNCMTKKSVSFGSNSIFNSTLDLNSKIAALKSSGIFPNISNSDIAKAAGQPRLVRTIKRRLSAKDIVIGPNQEVRRRRTRPSSSNIEVISTTTINPISSTFFPLRAILPDSTSNVKPEVSSTQQNSSHIALSATSKSDKAPSSALTTHGRRLRKRPVKTSPQLNRRNSISSSSSSNSSHSAGQLALPPPPTNAVPMFDLKQSVNRYFGAVNRIENGENFIIRAKRRLNNGQMQYLIEWDS